MDHPRVRLRWPDEIRHTGVVKYPDSVTDELSATVAPAAGADSRTRDRVTQLLLANGAATAAELGCTLGLSPAAIRRHLDAMLDDGDVTARDQAVPESTAAVADRRRCSC